MSKEAMAQCLEEAVHLAWSAYLGWRVNGGDAGGDAPGFAAIATIAVALYQERMRREPAKFTGEFRVSELEAGAESAQAGWLKGGENYTV